jgi:hypothetical protein
MVSGIMMGESGAKGNACSALLGVGKVMNDMSDPETKPQQLFVGMAALELFQRFSEFLLAFFSKGKG